MKWYNVHRIGMWLRFMSQIPDVWRMVRMLGAVAVGVALLMGGVAIGGFGSRFLSQRITQQKEVIAQQEQVVSESERYGLLEKSQCF